MSCQKAFFRKEYKTAKKLKSDFLICCCKGAWAKLLSLKMNRQKIAMEKNEYDFYSEQNYDKIIKPNK